MKTLTISGHEFYWPKQDTELKKVAEPELQCLRKALKVTPRRRCAIQAGGAIGVWPVFLKKEFKEVHSFEPCPHNYHYLLKNTQNLDIKTYHGALSDVSEQVSIEENPKNAGAKSVKTGKGIKTYKIDDLNLNCDIITLDVEGYEKKALLGAQKTIEKHAPTIIIEQNECSLKHGIPIEGAYNLLKEWGYKKIDEFRRDIILRRS